MKLWIERNLLMPLFLFMGLLLIITLCLTGGFAASVQGMKSGTIVLGVLWGMLGILGLAASIGYATASLCPRCGKRFTLIREKWTGQDRDSERHHHHHLVRCERCGYLEGN